MEPPKSESVTIFNTLTGASENWTKCNIKLNVPIDDGDNEGFDYTRYVASAFDNLNLNSTTKQYNFSLKMLNSTYQNHVLWDEMCKSYWYEAN